MKCIEMEYKKEKLELKRLLPETFKIFKDYDCYIAGGAITSLFTGTEINDIDIYFKTKEELFKCLCEHFECEYIIYISKKAITFRLSNQETVQLVFMNYYNKAKDIFKDFDFTINMGAFDIKKDKFVLHEDFLKDNVRKKLIINTDTAFPFVTGNRILKYQKKGYTIDSLQMTKLMLTISKKNIRTYETLEKQLGGMYGENILELSKEDKKKKFSLDNIIDKLNHYYEENHEFKRINDDMDKITSVDYDTLRWQILLDYKIPYLIYKNVYYMAIDGDKNKKVDKDRIEEYSSYFIKSKGITEKFANLQKMILYKFVKRKDGRYFSFYDEDYEYVKGKIQKPRGNDYLYLRKFEELPYATYANDHNRAILKCEVSIEEITDLELRGDIRVKELKVLDIQDIEDKKIVEDIIAF